MIISKYFQKSEEKILTYSNALLETGLWLIFMSVIHTSRSTQKLKKCGKHITGSSAAAISCRLQEQGYMVVAIQNYSFISCSIQLFNSSAKIRCCPYLVDKDFVSKQLFCTPQVIRYSCSHRRCLWLKCSILSST